MRADKTWPERFSGNKASKAFFAAIAAVAAILLIPFNESAAQPQLQRYLYKPVSDTIYNPLRFFFPTEIPHGTEIARIALEADTTAVDGRSISIRESPDRFLVYLGLKEEDYEKRISVSVFNLLGKKVRDVHNGLPYSEGIPYEIYASGLPKGIYICNVLGKNFRLDAKFIVSR